MLINCDDVGTITSALQVTGISGLFFLQLKSFCEEVKLEINICFDFRNQTNLSDDNFTFKLLTQNRWYRETVLDCMYVCSIYAAITLYVSSVIYIYSQVT